MPGKVKVRIIAARDLPVMDRASDLADAFAEVRLGNLTHKTDVRRKTLNPQWNSEWFRFELDDEDLQQEVVQIRVMDHDTYTAHDAIGRVNISLGPLLTQDGPASISGWFPIFDTLHGIRGEIKVMVKLDFFVDSNKFRQSSCGVQFFGSLAVPQGFRAVAVYGFVEELVVNDDPEYQWIDKLRTPRSSNEARQRLFSKLSGELQRKIGVKVLEAGGNAVIGYQQCFDIEGESGIVVRGIGTSVHLFRLGVNLPSNPPTPLSSSADAATLSEQFMFPDGQMVSTPTRNLPMGRQRRSSSGSDGGPPSPAREKTLSMLSSGGDSGSGERATSLPLFRPKLCIPGKFKTVEELELPFFTLKTFPPGFLCNLGGVVSARSVKLLDKINNPEEPETRDAWWMELRTEIRSHARALGCHAVIGYTESTSICEELIVLSASGTAACVNLSMDQMVCYPTPPVKTVGLSSSGGQSELEQLHQRLEMDDSITASTTEDSNPPFTSCSICHIPYSDSELPFPVTLTKCMICKHCKVPDVLFTSIEPPSELAVTGKGCFLQARVCRTKKKEKGEPNADIVSNVLPFLEYELHQQLMNKLKVKGMNALFGLQIQVSVGEALIVGVASATAVYLSALPCPPVLRIAGKRNCAEEDKHLVEMQKQILDTITKNKVKYNLSEDLTPPSTPLKELEESMVLSPTLDIDEENKSFLDLSSGGREAFVVEIDDKKDEDIVTVLLDTTAPDGFNLCNTDSFPGLSPSKNGVQMMMAIQHHTLTDEVIRTNQQFAKIFDDLIKSFWFKLRNMFPCSLHSIKFDVTIPVEDNILVAVTGVVSRLEADDKLTSPTRNPPKFVISPRKDQVPKLEKSGSAEDLLFPIEEVTEQRVEPKPLQAQRKLTPERRASNPVSPTTAGINPFQPSVEVTPSSCVPCGAIHQYLGHINMFFIRESLSVRENGGLNFFMQGFIAEVNAILRAHVLALGGNALVAFHMNELVLLESPHKNQAQCLINISGDAVQVVYDDDMEPCTPSWLPSAKKRTHSSIEPHMPYPPPMSRQRSLSGEGGSTPNTPTSYDPFYGTEI